MQLFEWSKPDLHQYFSPDADWARLRSILHRNTVGSDVVLRTPFFKGMSPGEVLSEWDGVIRKYGLAEQLLEYEADMRAHVGPMSTQLPLDQMMQKIEGSYINSQSATGLSNEAMDHLVDFFSPVNGIRTISFRESAEQSRTDTFSGSEYATTKGLVMEPSVRYLEKGGTISGENRCAIMVHRGQEGGPDVSDQKHRVAMAYPYEVTIAEGIVYKPFTKAVQAKELVPGWVSNDLVDIHVTKLFDTGSSKDPVIATDFQHFDESFNRGLQRSGLEFYSRICTPSAEFDWWKDSVYPLAYNLPLLCNEDFMISGQRGMGSGSEATQDVETPIHKGMQYEAAIDQHTELNPWVQDIGDDGLVKGDDLHLKPLLKTYERLGMSLNPDKQYVSTTATIYLRRMHLVDYRVDGIMVGIYPTFRALGRLLYQERFHDPKWWTPEMVTLRALSIIENCKWHPLFEEFVEFVLKKGDKLKLGLAIPGFFDRLDNLAAEAQRHEPDFLGYIRSIQGVGGLSSWRTVQYLMNRSKV